MGPPLNTGRKQYRGQTIPPALSVPARLAKISTMSHHLSESKTTSPHDSVDSVLRKDPTYSIDISISVNTVILTLLRLVYQCTISVPVLVHCCCGRARQGMTAFKWGRLSLSRKESPRKMHMIVRAHLTDSGQISMIL